MQAELLQGVRTVWQVGLLLTFLQPQVRPAVFLTRCLVLGQQVEERPAEQTGDASR